MSSKRTTAGTEKYQNTKTLIPVENSWTGSDLLDHTLYGHVCLAVLYSMYSFDLRSSLCLCSISPSICLASFPNHNTMPAPSPQLPKGFVPLDQLGEVVGQKRLNGWLGSRTYCAGGAAPTPAC